MKNVNVNVNETENRNNKAYHQQVTAEQMERILKYLSTNYDKKANLMITGCTGAGKSSTINALFNTNKAVVGTSPDPETMSISRYTMGNLEIWDTPGLGDGKKDEQHAKAIVEKLHELGPDGAPLIDYVLVIVNGASKDFGTTYRLINDLIIPNLGENKEGRVLICINQCDRMGGPRDWDYEKNSPSVSLRNKIDECVRSVHDRIKAATGVDAKVIEFVAGYMDPDTNEQEPSWNLPKLWNFLIENLPKEKRIPVACSKNPDEKMWAYGENNEAYERSTFEKIVEGIKTVVTAVVEIASVVKLIFPFF